MTPVLTFSTANGPGVKQLAFIPFVCVTVGGLNDSNPVKCSRDTVIVPDKSLQQAISDNKYDAVVIPGGLKGSQLISEVNRFH
ncbi:protein DJ-1alpha [Octopus bimaculoides]|uniref:protein DJ-1alpha n=1 Tax=Octopus bimaculoides TaxID=37653 RepID=UPI0022E14480|nr:protein DJ-1alpha [Octopus bimaculoides]